MSIRDYWIMYVTIFNRESKRIFRIWPQTLLPSVITIVLYFLIFGKVVGARIGDMHDGITYMQYITPGLIIMAVIQNSYGNVVSSFFGIRFSRAIEELLVSPVNNHIIVLGYISGGIFRGFLVGVFVSIAAFILGGFTTVHSFILVLAGFIFCGALFSLGGLLNAIFSQKFDDTTIFPTFVLTPLIYLGGVFYDINNLSGFWHFLSACNPLFYIVDFVRYGFIGISTVNPYIAFSAIVFFTFVLYYLSWYLLNKGIRLKP
ncbi:ABC-2 type transport system permease protein [Allofrancisella inopinata]|uniref:Transport permease protein n=1 Tax=Allofrancisella inopinata TaxID=1085647 RepID=A0AAE6YK80_9GAMM|nr:ABC transporter permease [Allofrancisella inopinata]QIV96364.1 ABC transporter permease [Allofrancisella inopinata]TDT73344.1 ABC-2 type transport system permease protein [Allofrancisella inopinata]